MTATTVIELAQVPALTPMLAKVAVRALPIPGLGGGTGGNGLPDTTVRLREAAIDRDHVVRYAEVCGFGVGDALPVTYLHMVGFPLSVQLMTQPDFPFGLLGMVHIRNTITSHRPVRIDEAVDVAATVTNLRPHAKGVQMDCKVQATADGTVVWTSTSTYLKRSEGEADTEAAAVDGMHPVDDVDVAALPMTARWQVPSDMGRRYARVSGDRNPIHLSGLSARAFGFPRAIAHGMWTKARCLAALEGRLPPACTIDVAFKLPLLLPATVEYASEQIDGGWTFGVRSRDGKPHLAGVVSVLGLTDRTSHQGG